MWTIFLHLRMVSKDRFNRTTRHHISQEDVQALVRTTFTHWMYYAMFKFTRIRRNRNWQDMRVMVADETKGYYSLYNLCDP